MKRSMFYLLQLVLLFAFAKIGFAAPYTVPLSSGLYHDHGVWKITDATNNNSQTSLMFGSFFYPVNFYIADKEGNGHQLLGSFNNGTGVSWIDSTTITNVAPYLYTITRHILDQSSFIESEDAYTINTSTSSSFKLWTDKVVSISMVGKEYQFKAGGLSVASIHDAVPTPLPGAAWLLGAGLVGLVGIRRKGLA